MRMSPVADVPEHPLRELTRHIERMPAWPVPSDYPNENYLRVMDRHTEEMIKWSMEKEKIEARILLYEQDRERENRREDLHQGRSYEEVCALVRKRIIDRDELDIVLPLLKREYLPINPFALWWGRIVKAIRGRA